ncbi:MAG: hypothetical protein AAF517_01335 [Planctomycetota bacterium]
MKTRLVLGLTLSFLCTSWFFGNEAKTVEELMSHIVSDDAKVRRSAKLSAHRFAKEAIVPLARVMEGGHREGAITARHTITRIVHYCGRPGAEAERPAVLDQLRQLTMASFSSFVRRESLHWISLIGGDADVEAVAACLWEESDQIGEAARLSLERLSGEKAIDALIAAIGRAKGSFRGDLVFSLGKKASPRTLTFLAELSQKDDNDLQLASFQALARTGEARALASFESFFEAKEHPLRAKVFGEYLRLGDLLYESGDENRAIAIRKDALRRAPFGYQRERCLTKLCRPGDILSVDSLLVGLDDSEPRVRGKAMEFLDDLSGVTVYRALREGYDSAKASARPIILRALAGLDAESSKELVQIARSSPDVPLRLTALDLEGAVDASLEKEYLKFATEESLVRATALRAYLTLAEQRLGRGEKASANEMFDKAVELAKETPEKKRVLAGLLKVASPGSLEKLRPFMADAAVARDATVGFLGLAAELGKSGDVDGAEKQLRSVLEGSFPSDLQVQAAEELKKLGRDPRRVILEQGFVLDWWLIGSFPADRGSLKPSYFPEERVRLKVRETIGPRRFVWKKHRRITLDGKIDLLPEFRRRQNVVAYAYTEIESAEARDVTFLIGSDDGVACFLNGTSVHVNDTPRGWTVDQDRVELRLEKGTNKVLLKVGQGAADWGFSLRVTDRDGKPISMAK